MGTLNVWFLGIVTHIFRENTDPDASPVRKSVCVSWPVKNQLSTGNGYVDVPAHIPYLSVFRDDIVGEVPPFFPKPDDKGIIRWGLSGIQFRILNVPDGLIEEPSWPEIASLEALTPGIGPIRQQVLEQNPAYTSMQFDNTGGRFAAYKTDKNAIVAILGVNTIDPIELPVLLSIQPYGATETFLALRNDTTITIANDADDSDQPTDFLLHYLTVTPYPPNPGIPDENAIIDLPVAKPDRTWPILTIGPGCSNSTYP